MYEACSIQIFNFAENLRERIIKLDQMNSNVFISTSSLSESVVVSIAAHPAGSSAGCGLPTLRFDGSLSFLSL